MSADGAAKGGIAGDPAASQDAAGAAAEPRIVTLLAEPVERVVVCTLIVLMGAVIVLATVELAWIIVRDVLSPPVIILELAELLDIFGFFLLILIGIELLETVKVYLTERVVHVELVVEVALIAIARKVIVLDVADYSPVALLGIAALILALAAAYHIQRRSRAGAPGAG